MADNETRNEIEVSRGKIANEQGKEIQYRVYKKSLQSKGGKPFNFLTLELFEVVRFVRKTDSYDGKKKAGDKDVFKNYKFPVNRIKDLLALLRDIDRQFNQSKAFGETKHPLQTDFTDDEVPF